MTCKIQLDNPGIFSPGDLVCGKVVCTFDHDENIRGIKCKLRGKEHTTWTEKRGKNNVRFTGKRTFLSGDISFAGEGKIYSGVYGYPFAFSLPDSNIPSSYQHQFGTIIYNVSAVVDKSFAFDYHDEITLHVQVPVTLRIVEPQFQPAPVNYQVDKQPGICCCSSDLMTLSMTLDKEIFQLGEVAKAKLQIDNNSSVDIHEIRAMLVSTTEFSTITPDVSKKFEKFTLASANYPRVNAHCQKTFEVNIKVPQTVVVASFQGCTFFKHWYSILIEAELPPFHRNFSLEANVQLGYISPTTDVSSSPNVVPIARAPINSDIYPPTHGPPYPTGDPVGQPLLPPPSTHNQSRQSPRRYEPSAPIRLAEEENLDLNLQGSPELPPPSYSDVMSTPPRVPSPARHYRLA